jgi:general secretion pathway protein F
MPIYSYKGVNAQDKKVSGIIDAESVKVARLKLRRQDIYPLALAETVEKKKAPGKIGQALKLGGGVPARELSAMTRQLSTLVGASLPLVQCLAAVTEQTDNDRLKTVLAEVRESVNQGMALADALAHYPRVFSDLFVNMIGAGEQSGALEVVLQRLADFTENQTDLKNKVLYAMLYPVVILVIMGIVIMVMFTYVIPKIALLLKQAKQNLPLLTQVMIGISGLVRSYWWLFAILIIGIVFLVRYYVRTPAGRIFYDRSILRVPIIGKITRNIAISRFCKTLSTLLMSGIPLLKALNIVEKVVSNQVLAQAIHQAGTNITEGAAIAEPLRQSGVFPPFVIQMIASGEQSGELEFMLQKASEAFDRDVENAINGLTTLIEPIMIMILAGMAVLVILSIILPIFDITNGIR